MAEAPFFAPDKDWDNELEKYLKENKTLAYMMLKKSEEFAGYPALVQKNRDNEWEKISWDTFGEKIKAIARALIDEGIQPGDMCSIFSQNRAEWAISDLGILATRAVCVPIYATNSIEEAEYIINDAGVKVIFTGNQEQYDKAKSIMRENSFLKMIVAFDRDTVISGGNSLYFDDLVKKGGTAGNDAEFEARLNTVNPDDILTLIYTSGTTGKPKGAIHTHRSFMCGMYPAYMRFPESYVDKVSLAILPLSHVFERMWSYGCMSSGVQIAYCPDPKQFVDVMAAIKPHYMTSVPRIWEKVYGTIFEGLKTASPVKRGLFNWAVKTGISEYKKKLSTGKGQKGFKYRLADKVIFSKIREKLGTVNCQVYHVGGAAFATEINEFFQAMGINLAQGFGLTEFFPVCVGFRDTAKPGYCGPMVPMVNARISPDGELQLKGGMCMKGYYKKPAETGACFTADGWFRTGDIAEIHSEEKNGEKLKYIKITDRMKDIIITAGGKNISPQQIEVLLGDELYIEQFVTIGEGRKFISALVVPNFMILDEYCKKNGIPFTSREELIRDQRIISLYEEIIANRTESLGQVEKIKKFTLLAGELTQEGGELTPTMKLRRKAINEKYQTDIENMYGEEA